MKNKFRMLSLIKPNMHILLGGVIIFSVISHSLKAQNVLTTKTTSEYELYIDSLKNTPYKWRFPILGQEIRKQGFDIPYPNGFSLQFVYGSMNIGIDSLKVSLMDDPSGFTNVDSLVTFNKINPNSTVVIARYDVWLLPFLNVYGMGGYVNTQTSISMSLPFLADNPEIDFFSGSKGPMVGWGAVIAAGVDSWFITGDYNQVWTFVPQLDNPAFAQEADVRIGYTFDFKKKRPWSNISLMLGGSWLKLNSKSQGNANLTDIFGVGENRPELLEKFNNWWDGLGPIEQNKLEPFYDTIEGLLSDDSDVIVYYDFNKKLPQSWSMTLGMNYQVNHRLLIDGIYTFLGSRNQFMIGVNYRFGFKGKNILAGAIDRKIMHKTKQ